MCLCGFLRRTQRGEVRIQLLPQSARGGAAAARWAHNPKVGGSSPPPATIVHRSKKPLPGNSEALLCCVEWRMSTDWPRKLSDPYLSEATRLRRIASSTASAALRSTLSIMWLYISSVNATDACPACFEMTSIGTPVALRMDTHVCLRPWRVR